MATWTAPTTRSSGELVTSSIWNTDLVENLKYLKDAPTFTGNVAVNGDLTLGGGASASVLKFLEPSGSGSNFTGFKAQAQTGNVTYTLPAADGSSGHALTTNGSGTLSWAASGSTLVGTADGRLTLTSGTPVTTSDVTAAGTLYYTPYVGNQIALYSGSAWAVYTFTERSLALTLTSGKNYDVFLYDNSGTLTLELSSAWTNDTTRADALTTQDGVYVKSGATTRRWLGTIRASGTNTAEDSARQRLVWNAYNRVRRNVKVFDASSNWAYATATWRQARATSTNQINIVTGLATDAIDMRVQVGWTSDAGANRGAVSFGEDSTSAVAANATFCSNYNNTTNQLESVEGFLSTIPAIGYHYYAWLENGGGQSAVGAFFGAYSAAGGISTSGVLGTWLS